MCATIGKWHTTYQRGIPDSWSVFDISWPLWAYQSSQNPRRPLKQINGVSSRRTLSVPASQFPVIWRSQTCQMCQPMQGRASGRLRSLPDTDRYTDAILISLTVSQVMNFRGHGVSCGNSGIEHKNYTIKTMSWQHGEGDPWIFVHHKCVGCSDYGAHNCSSLLSYKVAFLITHMTIN